MSNISKETLEKKEKIKLSLKVEKIEIIKIAMKVRNKIDNLE